MAIFFTAESAEFTQRGAKFLPVLFFFTDTVKPQTKTINCQHPMGNIKPQTENNKLSTSGGRQYTTILFHFLKLCLF